MTSQREPPANPIPELVRDIVLAQGNVFIKELLRRKKLPIGATKADFEKSLGLLQQSDIEEWLDEVEGWGNQHVYLYNVPPAIASDQQWKQAGRVRARVEAAGLGGYWDANRSYEFPKEQTLTGITFDGLALRLVWHKGEPGWVADPKQNFQWEIEGDLYEFRAFRQRADRAVTRFEMRLDAGSKAPPIAALFVPAAIDSPEHDEALGEARRVAALLAVEAVFDQPVIVSDIIKRLDSERLAAGKSAGITAQSMRLADRGAYVLFGSTSTADDYAESALVRGVRRSIKTKELGRFVGKDGAFVLAKERIEGLTRDVRIQLYGEGKRLRIWRQLTAGEVWAILRNISS
jgi:hypothetical protein